MDEISKASAPAPNNSVKCLPKYNIAENYSQAEFFSPYVSPNQSTTHIMDNSRYLESNTVQKSSPSIQNSAVDVSCLEEPNLKHSDLRSLQNSEDDKSIADDLKGVQRNIHIYLVESDAHLLSNTLHHTMPEYSSQVHGSPMLQEPFAKNLQQQTLSANTATANLSLKNEVELKKHSPQIHQVENHLKQQTAEEQDTILDQLAQQKQLTAQEQQQNLQMQKSLSCISSNSHLSSSAFGMYQTTQPARDSAQSVYLLSDKDSKDQGTVLGPIYCSNLVGNGNSSVVTSVASVSEPASVASSDYNLMSGLDHALTHVNHISHLALPNLFHTSETDSEVALTLASLGDPKNDKFEHSFFHQRGHDFQRNEELPSSLSMYSGSLKSIGSDSASYNTLPTTSSVNDQINQLHSSCKVMSASEPVLSETIPTTKSFITIIPATQPLETITPLHNTLERADSIGSNSRIADCRPTLVLRSRKGRGPSIPHHYHNFPDPEKIGKKKRKKEQKPKSSQVVQSGNCSDEARLPLNESESALPSLKPINKLADMQCTKSQSLGCNIEENKQSCNENVNESNFLMDEHEAFPHYSFESECVDQSRVTLHSNNVKEGLDRDVIGSSCDVNNIVPPLEVHNSFHQSHHPAVCSVNSNMTPTQPINATGRMISAVPPFKTQPVAVSAPLSLVQVAEGVKRKDLNYSLDRVVNYRDTSQAMISTSIDQIVIPVTSISSIASLSLNSSLHSVNSLTNSMNVHTHSTDGLTRSINTSIHSLNTLTSQSIDAPSHSINTFTPQTVMPTHSSCASTHSLNASTHSLITSNHHMHTPTLSTSVPTNSLTAITHPTNQSSHQKSTVTYCMSASGHPIQSLTHLSMPTSVQSTSTYHLTLPAHSDDVTANAFDTGSNPMATVVQSISTPARPIVYSGPCHISASSSDTLWNRSPVATACNDAISSQHSLPVASAQQMAALTLAEIDVLGTVHHSSDNRLPPISSRPYANDAVHTGRGTTLHMDDQTSILITSEPSVPAVMHQSVSSAPLTTRPSSLFAYHHQPGTSNAAAGSNSHLLSSSSGLFYTLPSSSHLIATPCLPTATSAACGVVSAASQPSNIMIYSSHQESDSSIGLPMTSSFSSNLPSISSTSSVKDLFDSTDSIIYKAANNSDKISTNITCNSKNSTEILSNFSNNSSRNTINQMLGNTNSSNHTTTHLDTLHNCIGGNKDQNSNHIHNGSTTSNTLSSCMASSNIVDFNSVHEESCQQNSNTAPPPAVSSSPCLLLLPPLTANSEKENLLGQLLKASEHCEPASLIPAGVVNDVIPAVGYRILEVSNLSEMIRCMHGCSGSGELGTIVIQEQASLREGAVSQLSVICTACQEGTVCATSNRTVGNEGPSTTNTGREDGTNSVGPWDINLRVQQLVQEFGITELQVQRMLEILGIFYRPSDPDGADVNSSIDEAPAASSDGLYPPPLPDLVTPTSSPGVTSITITSSDCDGDEGSPLEDTATGSPSRADTQPVLKFESIRNLSSSAALVPQSPTIAGGRKRKRPAPKHSSHPPKQPQPPVPKAKTLSCPDCSAKFVSLNHLKKHAQSHNLSQHTCPYCHSYFKKPYNLREHIKKHQNIKYDCDQCSRQFTDRSSLVVHRKSSHEMNEIRNHQQEHHGWPRLAENIPVKFGLRCRVHLPPVRYEFKCSECPKVFYKRVHFTDHMRLHTRETPFACEICGKRFIWRDSVKKHMDTHIAEAKYNCRLCGKWFRWLQGIRQHLQQQHKLKKCDVEAQVNTNGAATFYQKQLQTNRSQQKQVPQPYHQEQLQVEIQLLQSASPHSDHFLDTGASDCVALEQAAVGKLQALGTSLKHEPSLADDGDLLAAPSGDCDDMAVSSDVMMRSVATRGNTAKWPGIAANGRTVQPGSPEIRLLLSSDQTVSSVVVTTLDSNDNSHLVDDMGDEEDRQTNSCKLSENVAGLATGVGVW